MVVEKVKVINRALSLLFSGVTLVTGFSSFKLQKEAPVSFPVSCKTNIDLPETNDEDLEYFKDDVFDVKFYFNPKLNRKVMNKIKSIDYDDCNMVDFRELDYTKKVNTIILHHYDKLTDEDIKRISECKSLEKVILYYDFFSQPIGPSQDLYVPSFGDKKVVLKCDEEYAKFYKIFYLYLYRMYANLSDEDKSKFEMQCFTDEQMQELKVIDSKIMEIIETYEINDQRNTLDKLFRIIAAVTDFIDYDYNAFEDKDLAHYYNFNLLNSLVSDDHLGICANYSAAMSVIGDYCDMVINYVSGTVDGVSHAWNKCDIGTTIVPVQFDVTCIDDDKYLQKYKYLYEHPDVIDPEVFDIDICQKIIEEECFFCNITLSCKPEKSYNFAHDDFNSLLMPSRKTVDYSNGYAENYNDVVLSPKRKALNAVAILSLCLTIKCSIHDKRIKKKEKSL